jgi:hypothetical protein
MPLPPGVAAARRPITVICAAVAAVALLGALAYSFQATGNGCGSGWAAARKPLPSPLLTPEEVEAIKRDKRNPYEAGIEKARPTVECRSAGNRRLITAGVGGGLLLLPAGAAMAVLYWPRRQELTEVVEVEETIDLSDDAGGVATGARGGGPDGWKDRSEPPPS